eukprot:10293294-Heterocapsa_arctica.AAC.1
MQFGWALARATTASPEMRYLAEVGCHWGDPDGLRGQLQGHEASEEFNQNYARGAAAPRWALALARR